MCVHVNTHIPTSVCVRVHMQNTCSINTLCQEVLTSVLLKILSAVQQSPLPARVPEELIFISEPMSTLGERVLMITKEILNSICVKIGRKHLKEIIVNILIEQSFQDCFLSHFPENRR